MHTQGMGRDKAIIVYTDGACSNNPGGPGGWAAILNFDDRYDVLSGHDLCTTNNRMELTAVVEAVRYLISKKYTKIIINSDSAYVVNAIAKGWIHDWEAKGWKTKQGSDLANADLWKAFYRMFNKKGITIILNKVRGHAGHTLNEMADVEAKKEVEHAKKMLSSYNKNQHK